MAWRHYLAAPAVATLILILTGAGPAPAQQPAFFSVIEDLPVMPGFVEDPDGALEFETAAGRIVEISATGTGTVAAVLDYYSRALPQLGWRGETRSRYRREAEILVLEVSPAGPGEARLEVHFKLAPG